MKDLGPHIFIFKYELVSPTFICSMKRLSFQEQKRYYSLKNLSVREKFLKRHFTLYNVLDTLDLGHLRLGYKDTGQPILLENFLSSSYEISLSSSENCFVIAISYDHKIGVDIEYMSNIAIDNSLIDLVFRPEEKMYFSSAPESEKNLFFYQIWSQKEAFTRAIGTGLFYDLRRINVKKVQGKLILKYFVQDNFCFSYCIINPLKKLRCPIYWN